MGPYFWGAVADSAMMRSCVKARISPSSSRHFQKSVTLEVHNIMSSYVNTIPQTNHSNIQWAFTAIMNSLCWKSLFVNMFGMTTSQEPSKLYYIKSISWYTQEVHVIFACSYQVEICLKLHFQMLYVSQHVLLTHHYQSALSPISTVQNKQGNVVYIIRI